MFSFLWFWFFSFLFFNSYPKELLAQIWGWYLLFELVCLAKLACEDMLRELVNTP